MITDSASGTKEKIDIIAPLDLCQMVMTLEQNVEDGNVYPSIEVSEVVFTLKMNDLVVNASGELPLYKSREFETGVKKWMKREISQREKDFKIAL